MALLHACSMFLNFSLKRLLTRLRALPWVRDAFLPARPGFPSINSPCSEQRFQHSHGCILQMNTVLSSLATAPSQYVFILDSGATHHVAGDMSLFTSPIRTLNPAGSAAAIYQARDGRLLAVIGVGTVSLDGFHLTDVLCVPELPAGVILVSVPRLAERGYLVAFGSGQCYVQDQSSGEILGKGRLHGDDALYHLEYLKIPSDKTDSTAP
ncbi:unnamed protein product [Urochloa humidicola]